MLYDGCRGVAEELMQLFRSSARLFISEVSCSQRSLPFSDGIYMSGNALTVDPSCLEKVDATSARIIVSLSVAIYVTRPAFWRLCRCESYEAEAVDSQVNCCSVDRSNDALLPAIHT